jgi:hypothetical protein
VVKAATWTLEERNGEKRSQLLMRMHRFHELKAYEGWYKLGFRKKKNEVSWKGRNILGKLRNLQPTLSQNKDTYALIITTEL